MKIQDSQSLLEWNATKAAEQKAANLIIQLDKSNDISIYKLAKQIAKNKMRGEPYGDLEKELAKEIIRVNKECQALLGYEKKLKPTCVDNRELKMADHAIRQRMIKSELNK